MAYWDRIKCPTQNCSRQSSQRHIISISSNFSFFFLISLQLFKIILFSSKHSCMVSVTGFVLCCLITSLILLECSKIKLTSAFNYLQGLKITSMQSTTGIKELGFKHHQDFCLNLTVKITSCVTYSKLQKSFCASFRICKMRVLVWPASESFCEVLVEVRWANP